MTITAEAAVNDTTTLVSWWTSEDKQHSMSCGNVPAAEALAELIEQCEDDEQRADVMAGFFDVTVSDDQIRNLRAEAAAAGDFEMVELCDDALEGDEDARYECTAAIEDAANQ